MKHIIFQGPGENAYRADLLYKHLLNFYPRDSWTFQVKTVIKGKPIYQFGLKGKAEKVIKEFGTIFAE